MMEILIRISCFNANECQHCPIGDVVMSSGGWFWCMNGLWVYYANIAFLHHHMWCVSPGIHIFPHVLPGLCFGAIIACIVYPLIYKFSLRHLHTYGLVWKQP